MTRSRLYLLLAGLLLATAPWPFTQLRVASVFGFPPWAVYSLAVTVVLAFAIALMLQYGWEISAGDDPESDHDRNARGEHAGR